MATTNTLETLHDKLEKRRDGMEEDGKIHAKDRGEVYRPLNDTTLKESIDTRFNAMQKAVDLRFDAMQEVVDLHSSITQIALDEVERELSQKFDTAQTSVHVRLDDLLTIIQLYHSNCSRYSRDITYHEVDEDEDIS